MRLVYWVCDRLDDSRTYSIRERTKREAVAQKKRESHARYGKPRKVVIEYATPLDLVRSVLSEGGEGG